MQLRGGAHLAYSTNIHAAETWDETFAALNSYTLPLREAVAPGQRYGIGLRLSDRASRELAESMVLDQFRRWLAEHDCYVFTINGFPFGQFHGSRVKERVFEPNWSTPERLSYTQRLFDILAQLLPVGTEGTVSTLPGALKLPRPREAEVAAIRRNLLACATHIRSLQERYGCRLHLALEPEPLGLFENTEETIRFFGQLHAEAGSHHDVANTIGVTYDTCHFAVEHEDASQALGALSASGIRIDKIHLSCALLTEATSSARQLLRSFCDDVYLHQVVARDGNRLKRYLDLPLALAQDSHADEWRVHFHIPVYAEPMLPLRSTRDHLTTTLDWIADNPDACSHFELETYTWDVLPAKLRANTVVAQLSQEWQWVVAQFAARGLA